MMNYTIYDPITGEILYILTCNDQATADVNLKGCSYVDGHYSGEHYYIQNAQVCRKDPKPSEFHKFDYSTKTWQIDIDLMTMTKKNIRNKLLEELDKVNPVWFGTLTAQQQQELQDYRQALLDVPQQAGFPTEVIWPAKPLWL